MANGFTGVFMVNSAKPDSSSGFQDGILRVDTETTKVESITKKEPLNSQEVGIRVC